MSLSKRMGGSLRRYGAGNKIIMVGIVLVATILVVAICQICQIFNSGYIGTEFRTAFAIGRREGGGPEPIIIDRRDLTFTDFGWFHPDPEIAISTGRFKSSAVYVDAVTSHPRYNSSAWAMLSRNPDPNRPILAFIDVETCGETCWPVMCSWETSVDLENNRSGPLGYLDDRACDFIERALTSPAMASSDSRLVVLSCFPETPMKCMASEGDGYRNRSIFNKLVVVHQTAHKTEGVARNDMGIPPLSVKPVVLNATERDDITNCRLGNGTRPYLFSFKGRPRFAEFEEYFGPLHGTQGIYATFGSDHYTNDETNVSYSPNRKQINSNDTYMNLLRSSHFSGSPRGDCLYSYRFSEVLSAGAIPVVYADGWILPYTSDVVDWNDVAVLLPQGEVNRTVDILKSFSAERICEMHKKVLEFYDEYVIDSHGRLRGILKSSGRQIKK